LPRAERERKQDKEPRAQDKRTEAKGLDIILNIEIPYLYINKVEEYNAIFGQQQIENIYMTLQLIINNRRDKLEMMKKAHIQKCIEWCQRYDIPYHKNILNNNIFLASLLKEK
jgi:hypothetical protein